MLVAHVRPQSKQLDAQTLVFLQLPQDAFGGGVQQLSLRFQLHLNNKIYRTPTRPNRRQLCYSHEATRVNYLLALLVYSGHILIISNDLRRRMMSEIRKISKEITSNYPDEPRGLTKQISKSVLDKYLHEDYPCLDAMERLMYRIIPYWNISLRRMRKNISDVIDASWEFDYISENKPVLPADRHITSSLVQEINDDAIAGKNLSIYLVFWLPLSTMLLAHLLHNEPNKESKFGVAATGLIMLVTMSIIAFALYVYSNVLASPFSHYLQHLCPASYIALLDFIYALTCAASPAALLIPMTILYACAVSWAHFRVYNQALKPTLLEMVALFCIIVFLHCSAAYFYYLNFSWFWSQQQSQPATVSQSHQLLRRQFHEAQPQL